MGAKEKEKEKEKEAEKEKEKEAVVPMLAAPATPVRLHIRDLLALEVLPEESQRHINNLVLRFNTELKGVYRHYAQLEQRTPPSLYPLRVH